MLRGIWSISLLLLLPSPLWLGVVIHVRILSIAQIEFKPKILTGSMSKWVECLPVVRETWVQSEVASYQRLLKWYLIPPCLTLSNMLGIKSKVEQSRERTSALLGVVAIEKGTFWSPSTTVTNFTYLWGRVRSARFLLHVEE